MSSPCLHPLSCWMMWILEFVRKAKLIICLQILLLARVSAQPQWNSLRCRFIGMQEFSSLLQNQQQISRSSAGFLWKAWGAGPSSWSVVHLAGLRPPVGWSALVWWWRVAQLCRRPCILHPARLALLSNGVMSSAATVVCKEAVVGWFLVTDPSKARTKVLVWHQILLIPPQYGVTVRLVVNASLA